MPNTTWPISYMHGHSVTGKWSYPDVHVGKWNNTVTIKNSDEVPAASTFGHNHAAQYSFGGEKHNVQLYSYLS